MFKLGIPVYLHRRIMQRDTIPISMDEWQEALRKEVERNRLIMASIGTWQGGRGTVSTRENLFRGILDPCSQPRGNFNRPKPRDPDAMDVDRVQTSPQETRPRPQFKCFNCGKEGHPARDCPKPKVQWTPRSNTGQFQSREPGSSNRGAPPQRQQPPRQRPQARQAKVEEVVDDRDPPEEEWKEEPPAYDSDKLEVKIRSLVVADRQKLMEKFAFMEGF